MTPESRYKEEVKTYQGFTALMKWGTIASLALGTLVVILIAGGPHH